jgi:hypothetical protein
MSSSSNPNSFTAETLVHTRVLTDSGYQAQLKPIGQIQVGDEVLAWDEVRAHDLAQAQGQAQAQATGGGLQAKQAASPRHASASSSQIDSIQSTANLGSAQNYQKVTDLINSHKEQTLIHITLDNGQKLTATQGHPFNTTEGWRDAVLLKKGGKLLLKGGEGDEASVSTAQAEQRYVTITEVRTEHTVTPVFNLEVANLHTFYVGTDGVLVHNGCRNESRWFSSRKQAKDASMKRGGNGIPDGPDKFGKDGHFHDDNHNDKSKPNIHYRWGQRRCESRPRMRCSLA